MSVKVLKLFSLVLMITMFCCSPVDRRFTSIDPAFSGVDFNNKLAPTPELNILTYLYYYNGGGVTAGDFNGDGWVDLFFTGNQVSDKLYLNRKGLQFEDVTSTAMIHSPGWSTGSTHIDVNNDGLLDLYICKAAGYRDLKGRNLLFVNQGTNDAGIPVFKESAEEFGLDFSGLSTQASFFDYDLDGDLDMFLLNHSVHPNRAYGHGSKRNEKDSLSGDRLYRNDGGSFSDVTDEADIFQGSIGYGLGVSVGDVNADGFPDLYIGNDFFENDYLYINQGDGTFLDVVSSDDTRLGHTSHYSMGNNMADINNDGLLDILSLDMLPENLETLKNSGNEYAYPIYRQYLRNGYEPQYMQNTLHVNRGNGAFSEVAHLSGIAATEWSWSVLVADLDMDGLKDIYVSNGIKGATNDMDFVSFIAQDKIQRQLNAGMNQNDMPLTDELPEKKVPDYIFRGKGNLSFENVSGFWQESNATFSNGAITADLDNDGDLDIVVNNIDAPASILKNNSKIPGKGHLTLSFDGPPDNPFGVGAKVKIFVDGQMLLEEHFPSRSYLSSCPNTVIFGLDTIQVIDSLHVIWPGGKYQGLFDINVDQQLSLAYTESKGNYYVKEESLRSPLINSAIELDFTHEDPPCLEFEREPLIPFAKSNQGPSVSVADVNGDGLQDLFIGGAKKQASALFYQDPSGKFLSEQETLFNQNSINEATDQLFFDADNDGDQDLLVVFGGNEFKSGDPLRPLLYLNEGGVLDEGNYPFDTLQINASVVKAIDYDQDGDMDIILGSNAVPWAFGQTPWNYIYENVGGTFRDVTSRVAPQFSDIGLVEDVEVADMNLDGLQDIVVAGHWMPISIFYRENNAFVLTQSKLENTTGWWNSIVVRDFDQDGDMDVVAGNWGMNTRLAASPMEPITLYRHDFDQNGTVDPILSYFYGGRETVLASKDELVKQLPGLNKNYLSYKDFARANFDELFPTAKRQTIERKQIVELASVYLEGKGNGQFSVHHLPSMSQVSSVHDIETEDFNNDGFLDIFLVGNSYEISTQLGRLDGSHGLLLLNDRKGFFEQQTTQYFDVAGPARDMEKIRIKGESYLVVTINNDKPVFLKYKTE